MGASNFTNSVDNIFLFILAVSVALLVGITITMIYFIIRYNHKRNPRATDIPGNVTLEVVWTVIPLLIVMGFFYYGYIDYKQMRDFPDDAMQIKVTGRMWSWLYTYPNGLQTDTLYLPVGKPVTVNLESMDVIHSFYIPAFRLKMDAVPGVPTKMWFTVEKPGSYQVLCAEYCGDRHSYMLSKIVGMPQAEFDKWYASASAEIEAQQAGTEEAGAAPAGPSPEKGARLVKLKGCVACHSLDGSRLVGPSFRGMFGKTETVIVNGKEEQITADEDYIRQSILEPSAAIVKGYPPAMPPQRNIVTDDDIEHIIAYLKTLK